MPDENQQTEAQDDLTLHDPEPTTTDAPPATPTPVLADPAAVVDPSPVTVSKDDPTLADNARQTADERQAEQEEGTSGYTPRNPVIVPSSDSASFVSRFLAMLHRMPRYANGMLQRLPTMGEVEAIGGDHEDAASAAIQLHDAGHITRQSADGVHGLGAVGQDDNEAWMLHDVPVERGEPVNTVTADAPQPTEAEAEEKPADAT